MSRCAKRSVPQGATRVKCVPGFLMVIAGLCAPDVGMAQSFQEAVLAARRADAQYAAQVAAVENRRLQSSQAGAAFYPTATFTYSRADLSADTSDNRYVTVQQPVLSYDRTLTRRQAEPLSALSVAELDQADNELALRVFTAMAEIVRNREQIRALGVQIDGLQEQLRRSTRMRELGQGTVTEVSDFQVRVAVAQANRVNLRNALQSAERNFTLLTELRANTASLDVRVPPWQDPRPVEDLVAQVRESAPTARSGKYNVDLAEIAAKHVTAQYLPQVNLQMSKGQRSGNSIDGSVRVAIVMSAPLGVSSYYDYQRAANDKLRVEETLRFTQDTLATDVTRLHMAVASYRDEIVIRRQAVDGARLSVDANVKSYQGGVKTNIDVITSYQTLADAEVSLVNSRLSLAEAELRLNLLTRPLNSPVVEMPATIDTPKALEVPKTSRTTDPIEPSLRAEPPQVVEAPKPITEPTAVEAAPPAEEPKVVEAVVPSQEKAAETAPPMDEATVVEMSKPVHEPTAVEAAKDPGPVAEKEAASNASQTPARAVAPEQTEATGASTPMNELPVDAVAVVQEARVLQAAKTQRDAEPIGVN